MKSTSERWLVVSAIAIVVAALAVAGVCQAHPSRAYAAPSSDVTAAPEGQPMEQLEVPGDEGAASEAFPQTEPPTVIPPEETIPPEATTPPEPTAPPEPTTPPEPTGPPLPPTSPPPSTRTTETTETSPTLPGFETTLPFTGGNPVGFVVSGLVLMAIGAAVLGYGPLVNAFRR